MAHLRRKKDHYYAEFYDPDRHPKRKWVALGTTDKRGAMHRLADLDRRHMACLFDPWEDATPREGLPLREAVEQFLADRADRRPKTLRADRSTLELLESKLPPGVLVKHVTPKDVARFLDRPDLKPSSVTTYHARLKRFFGWCVERGAVKADPMAKMSRPRAKKSVAEFLTRGEYEALVATIEADADDRAGAIKDGEVRWLADVVRVAVGTGLRLGELCNLRRGAVNLDTGFVTVRASEGFETKSGHERSVYVTGEARAVLERLVAGWPDRDRLVFEAPGGGKLDEVYVSKRFKRYARACGLSERVRFHTLRHTYASWLVMAGVDLFRVKELLGHASIETTMRYAHLRPQSFKSEIERVFGGDRPPGRVEDLVVRYQLAA